MYTAWTHWFSKTETWCALRTEFLNIIHTNIRLYGNYVVTAYQLITVILNIWPCLLKSLCKEQARQCTYNVTLWRVRITIISVETQKSNLRLCCSATWHWHLQHTSCIILFLLLYYIFILCKYWMLHNIVLWQIYVASNKNTQTGLQIERPTLHSNRRMFVCSWRSFDIKFG
jgi:hypothetical protein